MDEQQHGTHGLATFLLLFETNMSALDYDGARGRGRQGICTCHEVMNEGVEFFF